MGKPRDLDSHNEAEYDYSEINTRKIPMPDNFTGPGGSFTVMGNSDGRIVDDDPDIQHRKNARHF